MQHTNSVVRCHGELTMNGLANTTVVSFSVLSLHCEMEDIAEEQQQQTEKTESSSVAPVAVLTNETTKPEQPPATITTSLLQSLLQEQSDETGDKKKKKKKKAKVGRQKELVNIDFDLIKKIFHWNFSV